MVATKKPKWPKIPTTGLSLVQQSKNFVMIFPYHWKLTFDIICKENELYEYNKLAYKYSIDN
jgi:hypothetical protein